jgi:hypothetical protein
MNNDVRKEKVSSFFKLYIIFSYDGTNFEAGADNNGSVWNDL